MWASGCAPRTIADGLIATESEYQGWRYYHQYCDRCHGQDALGSLQAPDLRHSVSEAGGLTQDSFVVIVRNGSAKSAAMPGFAELMEDERARQIYTYIKARGDRRLEPGRPRRTPAQAAPPPTRRAAPRS